MSQQGVSRRVLLVGASTLAMAGCARPPVTFTRPTASPVGAVRAQLDTMIATYAKNPFALGIAVRDLTSGADWNHQGDAVGRSASMAHVMTAALALRKARKDGAELPFDRMTQASRALMTSDDAAADGLWAYANGADAYAPLAAELGMKSTRRDPGNAQWSWTLTTPSDQLTLLDKLLHGTSALPDVDRLYTLDVLRKTDAAQTWGVGHSRSDTVTTEMKNGWAEFAGADGPWAVSSVGHVKGEGRDYLAAMMCRVPTFENGKRFLDAVGGDLFDVMGSGKLA